MRIFAVMFLALFCMTSHVQAAAVEPKVPSATYVNKMSNTVPLKKPETPAPEGRALIWIE